MVKPLLGTVNLVWELGMAIADTTDNLEFLDEDQNAAFDVEYLSLIHI